MAEFVDVPGGGPIGEGPIGGTPDSVNDTSLAAIITVSATLSAAFTESAPSASIGTLTGSGPVLYLPLGEDAGSTVAKDASGYGRNAYRRGSGVLTFGPSVQGALLPQDTGTGLAINQATPAWLEVPYSQDFDTQALTILGWYMMIDTSAAQHGVFEKNIGGVFDTGYFVDQISSTLRLRLRAGGAPFSAALPLAPADANLWLPFAFTAGQGSIKAYRDGQLVGVTAYTGSIATGVGTILAGAVTGFSGHGQFQHLALYNRALSQFEIEEITGARHQNVPVTYRHEVLRRVPAAWFRLNDAPGSTIMRDASGWGRHGTYVNTPRLGVTGPMNESAIAFDNDITQYATLDQSFSSAFAVTSGTWNVWCRPKQIAQSGVFEKTIAGAVDTEMLFYEEAINGQRSMIWRVLHNGPGGQSQLSYPLTESDIGQFAMFSMTFSGTLIELYRNKVLVGSLTLPSVVITHGTGPMFIGKLGSSIHAGTLDVADVQFFPTRLTATDMGDIYASRQQWFAEYDLYVDGQLHAGQILEQPQIQTTISDTDFGSIERGGVELTLALGPRLGLGQIGDEQSLITSLYLPKHQGASMQILTYEDGVALPMWSGIVDTMALGTALSVRGISLPIGFFEIELPMTEVTEAWLTSVGLAVTPSIDLGKLIPDVYGNVPRVAAVYVLENLLGNIYHYILCRGTKSIRALYRSMANSASNNGTQVSLINASEYTISTTQYPGYTCAIFPVRQASGGSLHTIYADIAMSVTEELETATLSLQGNLTRQLPRNAARIIRTLFTERQQPIDEALFAVAEVRAAEAELYLDFAIQERTQLQDILSPILQMRDMAITQTDRGWGLIVDSRPTQIAYALNEGDVPVPTILEISPREQLQDMQNAVSEVQVRCLPDLLASGDEQWLFTATRALSTAAHAVPLTLNFPQVRTPKLADMICDFIAKRIRARNEQLAITAPYAMTTAIRNLVSVTSRRLELVDSVWIITDVDQPIPGPARYTLKRWGPDPYVYEPGVLPVSDLALGTFEDFSRTTPPPIIDLTFPTGATFRGTEIVPGGAVKSFVTIRFTTPTTGNYLYALPRYRVSGSVIWVPAGGPVYQSGVVDIMIRGLDPQVTYEYSVQSVNQWGLVAGG